MGEGTERIITKKSVRQARPKAGLILLILSGLITLYVPLQLYWLTFVPGNFAFTGILFGGLLLACGFVGWWMPQYTRLLGVFGILLALLSLIGALGGLILGMLAGIVGGSLCVAWDRKEASSDVQDRDPEGEKWAV
ncbi:DUF6114 domain-containing protein [Salinithrix halophila]|uniref:DUF6114 domain-containing protein n=1 Tax=Salinithrix halophila TaxID=1485204 RepID=A0ABV8JIP3_9BACL